MDYSKHNSQRGFYVTALTVVLATIAFVFLLGYSSYYAKRESQSLLDNQKTYLYDLKSRLLEAYATNLLDIDADLTYASYRDADRWFELAGLSRRWELQIAVSDRLEKDGVKYTVLALWLPTETDAANPPTFDPATGAFSSCSLAPCPDRAYTTVSGYDLQAKAAADTKKTLEQLAEKAQAYFRARNLAEPTHNVSTNYFLAPYGTCTVTAEDLPCAPTYTAIVGTTVPQVLHLDSDQTKNGWGLDVEFSNVQDSNITAPPYTMSFRTTDPWGNPLTILAVQPL